jgi:Zn-finger nucleic acid-binding protein
MVQTMKGSALPCDAAPQRCEAVWGQVGGLNRVTERQRFGEIEVRSR